MDNIFFNAHHSPIGAFSSFTLGFKGANGGLGKGLEKPANTNVYLGLKNLKDDNFKVLPFYKFGIDESKRYESEKSKEEDYKSCKMIAFSDNEIQREFEVCTDRWLAGDLDIVVYSQVCSVPNPELTKDDDMKTVLVPSVLMEITIDNTQGKTNRKAFIGYDNCDPYYALRHIYDEENAIVGIALGGQTAIIGAKDKIKSAISFSPEWILNESLEENLNFGLGNTALMLMEAPPGERTTFRFAVCFYHEGNVTYGMRSTFYYTKFFKDIEDVGKYSLSNFDEIKNRCITTNEKFKDNNLSEDQRFMMNHAIRSYYGSTEFLEMDGRPVWIVNEGEYRILNTLDLTVDQLFFEIKMNPWTVRNVLDLYLEKYSYRDMVCFPGDSKEYMGGLTFTHDMGVANVFSPQGKSSYEMAGLDGCFSFMSHEQLVNWLCCAIVYYENTKDAEWLNKRLNTLVECFTSMVNRDNPDPSNRNGVMGLDSNRTKGRTEITTYDSLDVSLGQSRNNIYMAGKCWSVYVALEKIFEEQNLQELSREAGKQAVRCANTIKDNINSEGYIPAIIGENNKSRIIPAIEGLIFPYYSGCKEALDMNGRFGEYLQTLKRHFENVLVKDVCLFDDGGWKLSSTSVNSWLSKIYLCQFVARKIFHINNDTCGKDADQAHVSWLTHPEHSYWCWSDQIHAGIIRGSRYYPRGVTSIVWLEE